jgi:CBS domain containing-hemolysin-like protein
MTALLLVLLLVLLVINGVFVAAEFALVRARRSRVESLAQQDTAGARRVLEQMERMDEYLSACQVGITMASIGIGFLGEPAVADLLIDVFGLSSGFAHAAAIAFAFAFVTAMHISIGEQVPKMIAIDNAEPTARALSRPVEWFRIATSPFTVALTAVSNGIVRLFGVNPDELEQEHTSDDLRAIIDQSRSGGQLDPNEAGMLTGVFHLHEQEAREVMTPIPAVVTVDADESVETALRRCVSSGHTRLLAIEEDNPDRVRGVVHNNALARLYLNVGADAAIEEVIHDAYIVPETKPLDDLLAELQRQRSYIGVVVDEYGRTVGIVTVEDILEEVVGEIEDETDPTTTAVRRLANGDWYVRGHVPLGDLADVGIELPVDTDAYNSIGGYVFGELGRLPKRGDAIRADGYQIRVESVRENRIVAVRIHPPDAEHTPAAEKPVV